MKGSFIISLDFELHWGVAELWSLKDRKDYFETTRESIPQVLKLFNENHIHATWATVGFLFAKDKEQLLKFMPSKKPTYYNKKLSYYSLIDNNEVGFNEKDDPYHYAPSLIQLILDTPNQELGTHTFAHYYCNEKGQTNEQFEADLKAAQQIAKENFNYELQSLVFPRNQFNSEYLEIAYQNGIKVVRSNPNVWFWNHNSKWSPFARAIDTLMPISNSLTFNQNNLSKDKVLLLPASRFLRPYSKKESVIQKVKLNRIKKEMTFAAKRNKSYHLWWHPHNFGYDLDENMQMLKEIISHFNFLNQKYGFQSKSMIEMFVDEKN